MLHLALLVTAALPDGGLHVHWRTTVETTLRSVTKREVTNEQTWSQSGRVRIERTGDTLFPEVVTLVAQDGGVTLVDLPTRQYGTPHQQRGGDFARSLGALAFGLVRESSGHFVAAPLQPLDGGRWSMHSDAGSSLELELGRDLPLTAQDFADQTERTLAPSTATERAFVAALAALPAHPAKLVATHRVGAKTLTITTELVTAELGPLATSLFVPPAGFTRVDDIVAPALARRREQEVAAHAARRRDAGLDAPFQPTADTPLPPPLPGGSCRFQHSCVEALTLGVYCQAEQESDQPCPREDVYAMCEASDRERRSYYSVGSLEYGFPELQKRSCNGRYFAVASREADAVDAGLARVYTHRAPRSRWYLDTECTDVDDPSTPGIDGGCPDGWLGTCVTSSPTRLARVYGPERSRSAARVTCATGLWFEGPGGFDAGMGVRRRQR